MEMHMRIMDYAMREVVRHKQFTTATTIYLLYGSNGHEQMLARLPLPTRCLADTSALPLRHGGLPNPSTRPVALSLVTFLLPYLEVK